MRESMLGVMVSFSKETAYCTQILFDLGSLCSCWKDDLWPLMPSMSRNIISELLFCNVKAIPSNLSQIYEQYFFGGGLHHSQQRRE